MANNLLLIVDVQVGFVNAETKPKIRAIESYLNTNDKNFDYVLQTKFKNHSSSPFVRFLHWNNLKSAFSQKCIFDYPTIEKDTYSSVNDDLLAFIKRNNIGMVYIVGFDTDACILSTCFNLFDKKIQTRVVEDLCWSGGGAGPHGFALGIMRRNFGKDSVVNSKDIVLKTANQGKPNDS